MDDIVKRLHQAATNGNLNIIIDIHNENKKFCRYILNIVSIIAAGKRHIECLKYAYKNGCLWDEVTCWHAARAGYIECLKYAHENGCPWNEFTCAGAAFNGHLECLKYAHENGCPWNEWTCNDATLNGHFNCLKYAHENGCPYSEKLLSTIVKKILIPKWRKSVKIRPYIFHWMEDTAKRLYTENGQGRKCDYDTFVEDFNNLIKN